MNNNTDLINKFYTAFQQKDYRTMQSCYAEQAVFSDPVFTNLNAAQVRSMWEMFCVKGKDLNVNFKILAADEKNGSAEWIAHYTFSATGRKVVNKIRSDLTFKEGKIIKQVDSFDFYKWARQALGFAGFLLGGTSFIRNKIRKTAIKNLNDYMNKLK